MASLKTHQKLKRSKTDGSKDRAHINRLYGNVSHKPFLLEGASYDCNRIIRMIPWMHDVSHFATTCVAFIEAHVKIPGQSADNTINLVQENRREITGTHLM